MTDATTSEELHDLELFREFTGTRRRSTRNRLVERHMGLAAHIAKRYQRAGVTDDDLRQVAMLGLVKAVDRFDPEFGATFSAFAGRTIEGELKRHFRDRSWAVRVPRSAKELHLSVRRASDELGHTLGRSPRVDELAEYLDVDRDDVLRGLSAAAAYNVGSLDSDEAADGSERGSDHQQALAVSEVGFEESENRDAVARLLERLPEREQEIVRLRFYEERSQSEIGKLMGMSQMHVSRLLRRSFDELRHLLDDPSEPIDES